MHGIRTVLVATGLAIVARGAWAQGTPWRQHDPARPRPASVAPGATLGSAPADAVVLFDGSSLGAWRATRDGGPARWVMRDGFMEAAPGTGAIQTADSLGDMQLHIEWAAPTPTAGRGQGRGNSGVIIMGKYEVQILDSYDNTTYADGQAAALYGQYPPLVNASRAPGEWQSYDIIFRGPRWTANGALARPTAVTVFHNGVLVQDHASLWGGTDWLRPAPYVAHPTRLPLVLQDHSNPVKFRNIWARPLPEQSATPTRPGEAVNAKALTAAQLDAFVGSYRADNGEICRVVRTSRGLGLSIFARKDTMPLVTTADGQFTFRHTGGSVRFVGGGATALQLEVAIAEVERRYVRVR
ncbi:MAG: DUF1080 domain-containing protein [Gemmatimonadota bacterium]|nr:DUF1080 domain-containing protein [Gemmatimonadota bacterium]